MTTTKLYRALPLIKWSAAGFGICGALLIALNLPISGWGFVIFLCSSTLWVTASILMGERAIMFETSVYTIINIIGICRWLF